MKTWRTAPINLPCGFDPTHRIQKGEPYLEIALNDTTRRVRCRVCALARYGATPDETATAPTVEPTS